MWASIIASFLPFAIKILNMYFENNEQSKDARAAYIKFLEAMQGSQSTPAKMKESYEEQLRRLREGQP